MDVRSALKEQYHAGLAMLADCIEKCPDEVWTSGTHPRTFWRIAFHALFYTQLYLGQNEEAFQPWPHHREGCRELWGADVEPFELPPEVAPYERSDMLGYLAYVDGLVEATVDQLDLDSEETGFYWYKNMSKLSHELMNLRHIQGHVGQLSELLMQFGIDTDWVGKPGRVPASL
jgi:hypothetical protein